MQVDDMETAIKREEEDLGNTEKAGLTTTKSETTYEEIMNAIGDSVSDLASFNNWESGEDKDGDEEDPQLGKVSEDDEPGLVMCTISRMVQHRLQHFHQQKTLLSGWNGSIRVEALWHRHQRHPGAG